jgi:hypothetical protein
VLLEAQHFPDFALDGLLPFPAYQSLARMLFRLFERVNVIALEGSRSGKAVSAVELNLGLAQAPAEGKAGQAVNAQVPRFVAAFLTADNNKPVICFKARWPGFPDFSRADSHRSGRCTTVDMAFSSAKRSCGSG